MRAGKRFVGPWIWDRTTLDFNEIPDEVKLPIMAAVGGSVWRSSIISRLPSSASRGGRISTWTRSRPRHQRDVGQAELIHRIVDQHLLQENSASS